MKNTHFHSRPTQNNRTTQRGLSVPAKGYQGGIVLVVALIVLVAMALAGIAMVRQISSGVGIAGNIGFRQNAVLAADYGAEVARVYFTSKTASEDGLIKDSLSDGYFSSVTAANVDFTKSSAWTTGTKKVSNTSDSTGNTITYQIHRMCSVPNISAYDPSNNCVMANTNVGLTGKELGSPPLVTKGQPYFRTTIRVQGTRGTTSFVQVMSY
jgi:type IV pilus assembly protein PilX